MKKKQKKNRGVDKLFLAGFLASIAVLLFLWGWAALNWESAGLVALFLLFVFGTTLLAGKNISKKGLSFSSVFTAGILGLLCFGFGAQVSRHNWFGVDYWINGSIREIKELFQEEEEGEEEVVFEENMEKLLENKEHGLRVNFEGIPYPMLMSFDKPQKLVLVKDEGGAPIFKQIDTIGDIRSTAMVFDGDSIFLEIRNKKGPGKIMHVKLRGDAFEEVWTAETTTEFHHWGDIYKDKIYTLSKTFINLPDDRLPNLNKTRFSTCKRKGTASSTLIVSDSKDGSFIEEIELLPLIENMEDLPIEIGEYLSENCNDLLHLNDVRTLKTKRHAALFPEGRPGDLIVSMRNINLVVLIDQDTHKVKWHLFGDFYNQHSPRMTKRDTMLIFDNLGGSPKNGTSRILEYDVKTKEIVGTYEASGDVLFNSKIRGRIQVLGDDRIFIQSHEGGEVFEILCETKYLDKSCEKKVVLDRATGFRKYFVAEFVDILTPPRYAEK